MSVVGIRPAVPAGAQALGPLAPTAQLSVTVALEPADPAALRHFAAAVSTPGSADYGDRLDPAGFARRFGPSDARISSVREALIGDGLDPGPLSSDHLSFHIQDAPVSRLTRAFGTGFVRYRLADGRDVYANTRAPMLPAAIAGSVQDIIGLDDLAEPRAAAAGSPGPRAPFASGRATVGRASATGPQPCQAASSAAATTGAFTSDQLASAYGLTSLYGGGDIGAGQTVALFELAANSTADIAAFQSCYGTKVPVSYVKVDGGSGKDAGAFEADLDIEGIISLAPAAKVIVYQGPTAGTGEYDTYSSIISQDKASVISTSWGECESDDSPGFLQAENTLFEEAATQGQSVVAASGDDGSEDCESDGTGNTSLSVDEPAAQPFVTAAGGTTITSTGTPPIEAAWNDHYGATGGGISSYWAMPAYQSGADASLGVIDQYSSPTSCGASAGDCRQVPDVSAAAGPGYVVYYDKRWYDGYGTSFAAPVWASILALADASSACAGGTIGFANPALYSVAGTSYAADFNDITSGNNDRGDANGGLYPAGPGYDLDTGLGSLQAQALTSTLCADAGRHAPGPPTVGKVTAGNTKATVAFTPPTGTGGSPVTGYTVTSTDSTNAANGGQTVTGQKSPITVTGLINGDSYSFAVTATNAAGTGVSSAPTKSAVPMAIPTGVTLTVVPPPTPDVYIADMGNNQVDEVTPNGTQTTIGTGLLAPQGVAVDSAGDVYIADTGKNQVVEVTPGGTQTTIGTGLLAPQGIAIDASGHLYIADTGNNQVLEVTPNGTQTSTAGGLSEPTSVAVDSAGDVYIADAGNNRIVEIQAGGDTLTTIGTGLQAPEGVAVDASGDIYIADTGNNQVLEVSPSGIQTTVASGLSDPTSVAVDAAGDVYATETGSGTGQGETIELPAGGDTQTTLGTGLGQPAGVTVSAPPTTASYGSAVTLSATVIASAGSRPTGTVAFEAASTVLGAAAITASGVATLSTTKLVAGTNRVTATYQGAGVDIPSPLSGAVSVAVTAVPPGPPKMGMAKAGSAKATVAFIAPSNNGGTSITSYTVTAIDATTTTNGGQVATGRASPLTVLSLTNGDSYTFTVTATNAAGTSASSANSNAVTPSRPT